LIDNSNGEAAKWFSAFMLVEGGARTQHYELIKGKPLLFCYGFQPRREQVRTRMQQVSTAAGDAGVKVTVHEMADTGHDFPAKDYPFVRQWLREVAVK
jgi:predicted esterase